MTERDQPPTKDQQQWVRAFLASIGWDNHQIDQALRRHENERQERVRRSLGSHGPWGGEK